MISHSMPSKKDILLSLSKITNTTYGFTATCGENHILFAFPNPKNPFHFYFLAEKAPFAKGPNGIIYKAKLDPSISQIKELKGKKTQESIEYIIKLIPTVFTKEEVKNELMGLQKFDESAFQPPSNTNFHYIVSRYMGGNELTDPYNKPFASLKDLNGLQRLELITMIFGKLSVIHSVIPGDIPFIHGDIKGTNFKIQYNAQSKTFKIYFLDFGSAVPVKDPDALPIHLSEVKGSYLFLDPQVVKNYLLHFKTDVFACLPLMLLILNAKNPFELKINGIEKLEKRYRDYLKKEPELLKEKHKKLIEQQEIKNQLKEEKENKDNHSSTNSERTNLCLSRLVSIEDAISLINKNVQEFKDPNIIFNFAKNYFLEEYKIDVDDFKTDASRKMSSYEIYFPYSFDGLFNNISDSEISAQHKKYIQAFLTKMGAAQFNDRPSSQEGCDFFNILIQCYSHAMKQQDDALKKYNITLAIMASGLWREEWEKFWLYSEQSIVIDALVALEQHQLLNLDPTVIRLDYKPVIEVGAQALVLLANAETKSQIAYAQFIIECLSSYPPDLKVLKEQTAFEIEKMSFTNEEFKKMLLPEQGKVFQMFTKQEQQAIDQATSAKTDFDRFLAIKNYAKYQKGKLATIFNKQIQTRGESIDFSFSKSFALSPSKK